MRTVSRYHATLGGWLLGITCLAAGSSFADEPVPPGPFTDTECVTCHSARDPDLIEAWRSGPHGSATEVNCSTCHGERHEGAAARARGNRTCTGCHAGPASHSYATSKHGTITRLEERRQDWRQPLQRGRYRAPGCSYCHLHGNDHDDSMTPNRDPERRQWICAGCHSPRYVREQFASGRRLLEIAEMKLAEGEALIAALPETARDDLTNLKQRMRHHVDNVRLGVGHQSPDYQWWHGQPALDGDLIRIRDAITEYRRRKALE